MKIKNNKAGFTLIEAILYLAIAGTVLYFVSGFAFNAIFGEEKIQEIQDTDKSTRSMLEDISASFSEAMDINNDE